MEPDWEAYGRGLVSLLRDVRLWLTAYERRQRKYARRKRRAQRRQNNNIRKAREREHFPHCPTPAKGDIIAKQFREWQRKQGSDVKDDNQ